MSLYDVVKDAKELHSKFFDLRKVAYLRKVVYEELEAVESSFEAARRTMDEIQLLIRELRVKLQATTGRNGGRISNSAVDHWGEEAKLERLRKEVRTLKYKIPYSLIYPNPVVVGLNNQFDVEDPTVVWQPRKSDAQYYTNKAYGALRTNYLQVKDYNPDFYFVPHPNAPTGPFYGDDLLESLLSLDEWSRQIVLCSMCFPEYVIIKRTFLFNCVQAHYESSSLQLKELDDAMDNVLEKGFLKPIYKKSTSSVSSYWMDCGPSAFLKRRQQLPPSVYVSPSPVDEKEILYSDSLIENMNSVRALILGKWHISMPHTQHIEVADPDLFYKGMAKMSELRYISLRGISMIPELPQFITKLKKLQILDCKSCHNLEVIPNNINKLWRTLTCLDISECYLLDHMPPTLSDLLHLEVLKGFHVREPSQHRKTCTLQDLTKLSKLQKLHIITNVNGFPNPDHLTDLQKFRSLRNLGISWRGCKKHDESACPTTVQGVLTHKDSIGGSGGDQQQFSFDLEKLDLMCVPNTVTRVWLNPAVFKGLKKLYIRGGKFFDLGQKLDEPREENTSVIVKENQWTVKILRLKHLSELKMDKSELNDLFPELITLEKVDCPNLPTFPCDDNGIWVKSNTSTSI